METSTTGATANPAWQVNPPLRHMHMLPATTIHHSASVVFARQARMGVVSRPFMFDPIAVGELLEARAGRTDSGNLRPGSRYLLEQVEPSLCFPSVLLGRVATTLYTPLACSLLRVCCHWLGCTNAMCIGGRATHRRRDGTRGTPAA
jgi:hypothetical protein